MKNKLIIEKKIRYDSSIVEYQCLPVKVLNNKEAVLYHKVKRSFEMPVDNSILKVPKGSYTLAFYWCDKPYNVYVFGDGNNQIIGLYINIVKHTEINQKAVTFNDLIIDIVITPSGKYSVLDEDELPEALDIFEGGNVNVVLKKLLYSLTPITNYIITESEEILKKWNKRC